MPEPSQFTAPLSSLPARNFGTLEALILIDAPVRGLRPARAVEAVLGTITEALKSGDAVTLSGFGSFVAKVRAARTGRNPRTGEPVAIPASRAPAFKAGKALKDALN